MLLEAAMFKGHHVTDNRILFAGMQSRHFA